MTVFTARLLCPIARRQDWVQPQLVYLPESLYTPVRHTSTWSRPWKLFYS